MNFVKRGLRSLLYHWKNTAALVVIYFLSSALVLVGLNIRQACLATAEEAGEQIGADIAVTNTYQANSFTAEERNNLPLSLADQLAALPGVSSASWTATLSGASNNFSSAAMTREDGRAPLLFFASQTSSLLDLFTSQGASLALGSPLEREDRGLALVALPLAEENGWELDSVFSVTAASGQEISLQVAGIYLPGEGTGPEGGLGIPWDNTIVLCLEDAMELLGGEQVSQIRLELEDPKDARSLAAAVEETAGGLPPPGGVCGAGGRQRVPAGGGPPGAHGVPDDPHGRRRGAFGSGHLVFALPAGGEVQGSGDRGPALPGGGEAPDLSANAFGAQSAHGGGGHLRRRGGRASVPGPGGHGRHPQRPVERLADRSSVYCGHPSHRRRGHPHRLESLRLLPRENDAGGGVTAPGAEKQHEKFSPAFCKRLRVAGQSPATLKAAQPREKGVGALSYQPTGL